MIKPPTSTYQGGDEQNTTEELVKEEQEALKAK